MSTVLHSATSVVHMWAVLLALVAGTWVVGSPKGTRRHRWLGWLYVASMGLLLFTAFRMYYLFGPFGVVHWGALGSAGALLLGVGAAVGRAYLPGWQRWHYLGMGASVTGLYAALVVESTYRFFPVSYFWWSTLGPAGAVFALGSWVLHRHYPVPRVR
jgi:uncharacterized membrane protein